MVPATDTNMAELLVGVEGAFKNLFWKYEFMFLLEKNC